MSIENIQKSVENTIRNHQEFVDDWNFIKDNLPKIDSALLSMDVLGLSSYGVGGDDPQYSAGMVYRRGENQRVLSLTLTFDASAAGKKVLAAALHTLSECGWERKKGVASQWGSYVDYDFTREVTPEIVIELTLRAAYTAEGKCRLVKVGEKTSTTPVYKVICAEEEAPLDV